MVKTGILAALRERRAAAAIMFGLTAIPIIGFTMIAIDFSHVTDYKAKLNLAADAASLTAVRVAANAFRANDPNFETTGATAGQQFFEAETGSTQPPVISFSQSSGTQITATLTFSGNVPSYFSPLNQFGTTIGFTGPINVGVQSQATIMLSAYTNITLALDTSASMLIAVDNQAQNIPAMESATGFKCIPQAIAAGQTYGPEDPYQPCNSTLYAEHLTSQYEATPCAFACHDSTQFYPAGSQYSDDYYGLSKRAGVTLREDVVQSAASAVITQLAADEQNLSSASLFTNLYTVGVFTFDDATDNQNNLQITTQNPTPANYPVLNAVYPQLGKIVPQAGQTYSGSDFTTASNVVSNLTPPLTTANPSGGDTPMQATMAALTEAIPPSGDGSSATKRKQALILVTDGMSDIGIGIPPTRSIEPIDATWCAALRENNVSIYILYTTYYSLLNPPYTNSFYQSYVSQFVDPQPANTAIKNALVACTGGNTSNVIEAQSSAEINAGLQTLLESALTGAGRFTQ